MNPLWKKVTIMVCKAFNAIGLAAVMLFTACSSGRAIEHGSATASNGEIIKTCFDVEITPDLPGYLNIAALPNLTREGFKVLTISREEARRTSKPGRYFRDSHRHDPVGNQPSPVRRCWKNGDPRKNGLYRYTFGRSSGPKYPRTVLYEVYFEGDKAVYVEGWVHKQTNYKAVDLRPWDRDVPPEK